MLSWAWSCAALALAALIATLAAAIARPRRLPDWAVAAGSAGGVLAGAISSTSARDALEDLGPTVAFAAALLVLADGCRRAGLFAYLGAAMAAGARGRPRAPVRARVRRGGREGGGRGQDTTVVLLTPGGVRDRLAPALQRAAPPRAPPPGCGAPRRCCRSRT